MHLKDSRDRIVRLMARFVAEVEGSITTDMLDINRVSEDVLIPLFSKIYGHTDLENLNISERRNYPAIDLGDKKTRVAYQITSTSDSEKIKETLEKFINHKLYKKYDRLVIYILTKKQSTYRSKFEKIVDGKFPFDKENDILDYQDLLREISGFCLDKSREIENILEQHFGEEQGDDKLQDVLDWLEQVNNLWESESGTIKINREGLRNDLRDFALRGNGVVIGGPGVGKTYLLKELSRSLKSAEIPHLLLPIDQLGDGTNQALQQELFYEGDLIERLKSVPFSDKKAILLFDAFDAARNEQTRKHFLNLIRRAIRDLDNWNVVVTVRTYDAMKSRELLDLFGDAHDTEHKSIEISCRHFRIPPFDKSEILEAFDQIGCRKSIYNAGSQEFKNILANPFNLWLLEKILKSSQDVPDFSQIHSEVQLFRLFWQRRIEAADNEIDRLSVLDGIAREMVKQRSLSIKQSDVRETLIQSAWDDLLSDEILTKVSSTGQRIAFFHNILFDYAISVLLIDDEPERLEEFILEDASRPLFLRPSLTYFFTRLWYYDDSTNFWRAFSHILQKDQSVPLCLVARLIPTSVIANEARGVDELEPLLGKLQNREKIANEAVMRLLQSLRMLQIERDALWIDFFDQVSAHLHVDFAWDLATLTTGILERVEKSQNAAVVEACGRIGRRLLKWVWQEREANDWYNRFGGRWAAPLVAKTYDMNVDESRALLEKVLKLPQEDNFPIDFLSSLTDHVDKIWKHDPEFVTRIYLTVFSHYEVSDEKTSFSSSSILSMTSTRRQDYGMCEYRLIEHLPNFLRAAPLPAIQAVIQSLNFFIIRAHILGYLGENVTFEDLIKTFNFRGKLAYFVEDSSYMWDAQEYADEPIEMADALFEFIAELTVSEPSRLDSLLNVFRDHVCVAFFWKRLLRTASQFPKVFAPRLFDLCIAKPILMHFETSYELGLFLETAASEFTPDQLHQIEEKILTLPEQSEDDRTSLEARRDRLLAQIPANLLCIDEAKKIREKMEREGSVPENQPPVSFKITSETVTEEKWLQRRGVDTTTPENQELQRFSEDLDKFTSDWLNDAPTQEAVGSILPQLQDVYTTLKSNTEADQDVINLLWRNLTHCVAILGRVADNLEGDSFAFCRQVLLEGAKHEEPKPDPIYDDQFDSPGYSPFPRHDAARGLLRFAFYQPDGEMLNAIETLANDPVPSVRMVTAMELLMVYVKAPERFWHIMNNRAVHERNRVVQEYLYFTLTHVAAREEENEAKTTHVMAKLLEHIPLPPEKQRLSDPFADLLMWLVIERENSWALKIINDRFFKDPIQYANILTRAVNKVMRNYIVSKDFETPDGRERAKRTIEWLEKVVNVVSDKIAELYKILKEHEDGEVAEQLRDTYTVIDRIITLLYYEVAHERDLSEKSPEEISPELRRQFYSVVKPLMEQVINFALNGERGIMFAGTAHYFMQLLTSFLSCNPKEVLHFAEGVVRSSEPFGYNLDAIAVLDVVEFVEVVLADYRHEVRDDEECLKDLLNLLDMFAKTGWPDALKLVWRLDEVFR